MSGFCAFFLAMCVIVIKKAESFQNENISLKQENAIFQEENEKYKEQIKEYELKMQELLQKQAINNNINKGKVYEYKLKLYYESKSYKVFPNGYIKGKNDGGIDLIAYKDNEVRLIQAKCYTNPPKQHLIRQFIGDCEIYIKENQHFLKNKTIFKDFITNCPTIEFSVKAYLEEHPNIINYQIKVF